MAGGHCQQCRDVMHHCLQAVADRVETGQAQQVEARGAQRRHHAGTVAAVAVVVLMALGVTNPAPALDTPVLSLQPEQRFWGRAQTGEEPVRGLQRLAVTDPGSDHLGDPAGALPFGLDVLRSFFLPQRPADVTAMADLVIRCHERDVALSKQLRGDLAVEPLLGEIDRQEEVGHLLRELPKNISHPIGQGCLKV